MKISIEFGTVREYAFEAGIPDKGINRQCYVGLNKESIIETITLRLTKTLLVLSKDFLICNCALKEATSVIL
jgi:hypothetical protein